MNIVLQRMQTFVPLMDADCALFERSAWRTERYASHADIIQEGTDPRYLNLVLEGWACRYKQLEDGRRQILSLFIPGDMCDPCVFLIETMSHALATLTPAVIARIPEADVSAMMRESPALAKAFWFDMLVNAEVQRERTLSLGRRSAIERMAHLFCELLVRLRVVGLATATECDMPLTQADLGDALGLSYVHVNRTLQDIRAMKLIELRGRRLTVLNEPGLQALALFNPNYLHLGKAAA